MILALLLLAFAPIPNVRLNPQTVKEFQAYMEVADRAMVSRAVGNTRLPLLPDGVPKIEAWEANTPRDVTDGMIHDWIAAVFVPGAKVEDVVSVLKDYGRYPSIYQPDVLQVKLLSENGNRRKIVMRTVKTKVFTVILDIDYDIEYRTLPNGRVQVWSRSTAIREVDNAGKPNETRSAPDRNAGFLWALNTYWQLEQRDGGVYMECRAVSLTRGIPMGAGWVVKPMVTALPFESLTNTLTMTRTAVELRLKR
ncbi:MAG: hypothetical protein IPP47_31320 [Bryobacterales bacterium]|nr:hypothetical protein [Bryobacterales bacterium]